MGLTPLGPVLGEPKGPVAGEGFCGAQGTHQLNSQIQVTADTIDSTLISQTGKLSLEKAKWLNTAQDQVSGSQVHMAGAGSLPRAHFPWAKAAPRHGNSLKKRLTFASCGSQLLAGPGQLLLGMSSLGLRQPS